MKPEELRIGNLMDFKVSNGKEFFHCSKGKVSSINKDHIYINEIKIPSYKHLEPIELTEEWLNKFGFIKYKGNKQGFFIGDFETDNILNHWYYKGTWIIKINYVHQLQNLYFSLTGKELNYKN